MSFIYVVAAEHHAARDRLPLLPLYPASYRNRSTISSTTEKPASPDTFRYCCHSRYHFHRQDMIERKIDQSEMTNIKERENKNVYKLYIINMYEQLGGFIFVGFGFFRLTLQIF